MPCDTIKLDEESKQLQRDALSRLDAMLKVGTAKVAISRNGAIAFVGWKASENGLSDVCAYRRLLASNSSGLRLAVARAEALAGRKVDQRAIATGEHSHDGGITWGRH